LSETLEKKHDTLSRLRPTFVCLAVIAASMIIANIFGQDAAMSASNVMFFVVPVALVAFAFYIEQKYEPYASNIFILFLAFTVFSLVGEQLWTIYEAVYQTDPFPSMADFFWLGGYLFLAIFLSKITKGIKKSTTAQSLSIIISVVVLVPSFFIVQSVSSDTEFFDLVISLAYPVADAVILYQALNGFFSSLSGSRRDYLMLFLTIGIFCFVIADTFFIYLEAEEMYYTGHLIEILWACGYLLFITGLYMQAKYNKMSTFEDVFSKEKSISEIKYSRSRYIPLGFVMGIVAIAVGLTYHYEFGNYSESELSILRPLLYGCITILAALSIVVIFIIKKISTTRQSTEAIDRQTTEAKKTPDYEQKTSSQFLMLQKQLVNLEKRSKKTTDLIMITGFVIGAMLTYFVADNLMNSDGNLEELTSGRFLIEDLKGDTINTWIAWRLAQGEPLHITIMNSEMLPHDKIDAIKSAILSTETITIRNSEMGKFPPEEESVYYKGWKGMLEEAAQHQTEFYIPQDFEIVDSYKSIGDIVIILSPLKEADGSLGFTRSIADGEQNQVLKSFITIFDVKNLRTEEIAAIVRHEFGHTLGLKHSTATEDLMYERYHTINPYISQCDMDAIISLYNNEGLTHVTCEN